jgi:hypothetical protein
MPTVRVYPSIVVGGDPYPPPSTAPVQPPDDDDASYYDISYPYGLARVDVDAIVSGVAPGQIVSVTAGCRARGSSGAGLVLTIYDQSSGTWSNLSLPTSYGNLTGPTRTGQNWPADGSGNAKVRLQVGWDGAQYVTRRVTTLWADVTYERPPSAPSVTGPSGTVWTLSPAFAGTYSHPDGEPITAVEIELRRVSDNALIWNPTVTSGLSGSTWSVAYGGPALSAGVQYTWRARTRDGGSIQQWSPWSSWLSFTPQTNTPPSVSQQSPANGSTPGTLTPTFTWTYADANGHPQAAYQLQVQRVSDSATMWDTGVVSSGASSRVYAGTGLQVGVQYRWRIRVYDGYDWSSYTGWWTFTPSLTPDPPTLTAPAGLVDTLTPAIQGTYNQGSGGAEAGYQYQLRSNGVTLYDSGPVNGAIATGQPYGTDNPSDSPSAPPALQWGTAYDVRARSRDVNSQWSSWSAWLSFTTQSPPLTPTALSPADGAVVNAVQPTLTWTHVDPDGDAQQQATVELQRVSDGANVTGYPATLTQAAGSHQVSAALTASPATAYRWRVRTRATPGAGFGPFSAWQQFTVATTPAAAVTTPPPGGTVTAPALTVQWSMTGGSGTQATWRVIVRDGGAVIHDSGVQPGAAASYALPGGLLRNGKTYTVEVIVTDTLGQSASSGQQAFTTAWTPPPAVAGVQAAAVGSQEVG